MYCSGCANLIDAGLNYCSRCGAAVSRPNDKAGKEGLSSALGYIGGFGMFGFFAVMMVLVKNGIGEDTIVKIAFLYLAALFGICFMILRQTGAGFSFGKRIEPIKPAELRPLTTAQLYSSSEEPASSVIENTTRTLDEIPARK